MSATRKLALAQASSLVRLPWVWLTTRRNAQPAEEEPFLSALYAVYLGRKLTTAEKTAYRQQLERQIIRRYEVWWSVLRSTEFKLRHLLPMAPGEAVHQTRMLLIRQSLPPAATIVDLGGASEQSPFGALLLMGYPHVPQTLTIVDLPLAERMGEWAQQDEPDVLVTPAGTQVRYLYRSLADLKPIADGSVDLVFSGESIEHVSEVDGERALGEAYRVLKPGGVLCLDTPNRALTILQSPNGWIHPEHKKEYYVAELCQKIEQQGFVITATKALCPMPRSLAQGIFDWAELVHNTYISEQAAEGYLFFIACRKPE